LHDGLANRSILRLPQAPELLKPRHVPKFPQGRVYDRKIGSQEPVTGQLCGDAREVRAAFTQPADQGGGLVATNLRRRR